MYNKSTIGDFIRSNLSIPSGNLIEAPSGSLTGLSYVGPFTF